MVGQIFIDLRYDRPSTNDFSISRSSKTSGDFDLGTFNR